MKYGHPPHHQISQSEQRAAIPEREWPRFRFLGVRIYETLIALLAILTAWFGEPAFDGLATYYDHGEITRSGEPFALDMPTCAVDDSEWARLRGRTVLLLAENGRMLALRVADSGYLFRAGTFRRGSAGAAWATDPATPGPEGRTQEGEHPRYSGGSFGGSPLQEGAPTDRALRVVVDVPRETFRRLSPDLDTEKVWVWLIPTPNEPRR